MAIINDTDLLVVQKGGNNYTYSGANLKADITEIGGAAGGGVTKINAGSNVSISPTSGVGEVTISASGGTSPTPTLDQVCRVSVDPNGYASTSTNLGVNGKLSIAGDSGFQNITCRQIAAQGNFIVQAGNGTDGRVLAPSSIGLSSGVRSQVYMTISSGGARGLIQCDNLRRAEDIVGDVDTSNFINALKRITLSNYGTNTPIAINPAVLQADEQARFLTYDETYPKEELIPAFLIGVCQRQQELIENLSTRVAQLEAEHAQVMSNMQNNGGY